MEKDTLLGKFKQNRLEITTSTEDPEILSSLSTSWRVSGTGLLFAKNQPFLAKRWGQVHRQLSNQLEHAAPMPYPIQYTPDVMKGYKILLQFLFCELETITFP